jgi:hypothetical protein
VNPKLHEAVWITLRARSMQSLPALARFTFDLIAGHKNGLRNLRIKLQVRLDTPNRSSS